MELHVRGNRMMAVHSNPFVGSTSRSEDEVDALRALVRTFVALEGETAGRQELYHRVLAVVHQLCAAIVACEQAGYTRAEIVEVLEPVRRIHARSPFVKRLQDWPRAYPGDFETVEHLCSATNRAEEGTLPWFCESYALSRSIAQQHRNKVQHQAARIMRTLLDHPGSARVLTIACGSCPDLRRIAAHLPSLLGELWLNDNDADALSFSARALAPIRDRSHYRPGNALKVVRKIAQLGPIFDLVLAGGLFDYLPEKHAIYLIEHSYSLLKQGGAFFFTNIAAGNPYRPLIEYFGDWFLIERSEADIRRYCEAAGIPAHEISITREETGLTLLIEVTRS
ncbi:MAG: extracellular factor 3-hydroxypalmitic acid methyl ester biosynthesis protein [Acidobacteriota bacterium]|nr:extracellular factor 3-hydroxypalmitic acid methyl ester biosynthesis protein [Acidobacteriota bacterium]